MTIEIRKAKPEDGQAILEISSQIWGGTDYVPRVLDKWINGSEGILWCALLDDCVLGFARSTYLSGNRCWLEGIRVSPEARGQGLGKALVANQIKDASDKGFESCGLSSYIENYESLHIVRNNHFEEMAQFKIYDWSKNSEETGIEAEAFEEIGEEGSFRALRRAVLKNCKVSPVGTKDTNRIIQEMANSEMLKKRKGYLSYDWTFEGFSPEWVAKCIEEGDFYNMETPKGSAFFSFSPKHAKGDIKTLNYVSHEDFETEVLAYCIENALQSGFESFGYMAYNNEKGELFKGIGLETYNEHSQDVFVFEKKGRE